MKIAVFGGSGRTGIHVVEQALAQGDHVTVLVRDPNKLPMKHDNLTVIPGDVLDADQVAATIKGADAETNQRQNLYWSSADHSLLRIKG